MRVVFCDALHICHAYCQYENSANSSSVQASRSLPTLLGNYVPFKSWKMVTFLWKTQRNLPALLAKNLRYIVHSFLPHKSLTLRLSLW
ncbi:hypothetical protein MTO96_030886 [Rhipicephalus appendiculatus]